MKNNEFLTKYSVGCIVSKNKYSYGIHEIRFKVEEGQGVWPAFWFFGGVKNEEIDIFELKDERNDDIHVDTHCPSGCDRGYKNKIGLNTNWGGWMPLTGYLHDGFNVMALEWRADELIWFINGYPLAYFKGKFENPMNVYLNTSVAKDGGAFKPGPSEKTKWPNTFCVDYYRFWKPVPDKKKLILKKDNASASSKQYNSTYSIKPAKKRGLMFKKSKLNPLEGNITVTRSSDHQIIVSALGKLKETGLKLKIEGNTSKKNYAYDLLNEEVTIDIDTSDNQLNFTFITETASYTETLLLQ